MIMIYVTIKGHRILTKYQKTRAMDDDIGNR